MLTPDANILPIKNQKLVYAYKFLLGDVIYNNLSMDELRTFALKMGVFLDNLVSVKSVIVVETIEHADRRTKGYELVEQLCQVRPDLMEPLGIPSTYFDKEEPTP